MTVEKIHEQFVEEFRRRRFVGGLLPAIIDFLMELGLPRDDVRSFSDLVKAFPQQTMTAQGKRANTFIVQTEDGKTLSIRPFYNKAEQFYKAERHRHDYPSCAPHATQAWADYRVWIDELTRLSKEELAKLRELAVNHVLEQLPDRTFDPATVRSEPPTFRLLLEELDFRAPKGEPNGGAFQGAAFGFIRADNPHLQVQIDKVHTGSSRLQRIGDIDAWEGKRLAVSAEVKYRPIEQKHLPDLSTFINNVNQRGAIGLLIAADIQDQAKIELLESGVTPLTLEDLIRIVQMWDPAKQRIAIKSMVYYAEHVEQNSVLVDRLDRFLADVDARSHQSR